MKPISRISIVGMGALGILYGKFFEEALGAEAVSFLGDAKRVERFEREGVFCNGERCHFQMTVPEKTKSGEESQTAQLLIFAVKGTALGEAIRLAKPVVGPETVIISVLNGISSEEQLETELGTGTVIYCVAQGMDAVKEANRLTYTHMGQLCIGIPKFQEEKRPQLERVTELFERTGLPFTLEEDILHRIWSKWMLNVGVNQVVMVEEGTYGTIQKPGPARERTKAAMREVIEVAKREQVVLTQEDLDSYMALMDTLAPEGMPSMRQDGLAGRPSEVEMFAGTVIRKAEKFGLEVPVNRELYREIREREALYEGQQKQ